jgi:hypothetical protein
MAAIAYSQVIITIAIEITEYLLLASLELLVIVMD